jgi:predicted ATP-binding protein involved in virulence
MRINSLSIDNFRCFEHLQISHFNDKLNVFVGINGSGKTAILEAVRCLLGEYLYDLGAYGYWKIADEQIRVEKQEDTILKQTKLKQTSTCKVSGTFLYKGEQFNPYRFRESVQRGTIPQAYTPFRTRGHDDLKQLGLKNSDMLELPIIVYYSTQRLTSEVAFSKKIREAIHSGFRQTGYTNALSADSNYHLVSELIKNDLLTRQSRSDADLTDSTIPVFSLVERGLKAVFNSETTYYFDGSFDDLVIVNPESSSLPVWFLSDGYRNLVKLVLDLSCRAAYLNPQMGDKANIASGIVLIDEVDLHLHPALQRKVVPMLTELFPNIQFIISTHSPQVISSVKQENVFLLSEHKISPLQYSPYGQDSNYLLQVLFEAGKRPEHVQKLLDNYQNLVLQRKGLTADAEALRAKIIAEFGPDLDELIEADFMLKLQSTKKE